MLKAIYFPNSDFLDATLGSSPSQVWRALVEGRDAMKQGLVRRIGTYATTNARNQNWIPRDFMMRSLACRGEDPLMHVTSFIDSTSATWRMDLLTKWFLPMNVEAICLIPLSTRRLEDF
jgi:hypothetical protein